MDPRGPQAVDEQFAEFFDDHRLFGSGGRVPRPRLPTHPVGRRDWMVAVALLLVSLLGPWLGVLAFEGLVLFDPWRGASFWGWYAMVLMVQGVLCWAVGGLAALAANRRTGFVGRSTPRAGSSRRWR